MDNLSFSGRDALRESEEALRIKLALQTQAKADGLDTKTFVQVDAEQGFVELADPFGGQAFIQNQGSLSTGAISTGTEVRADWQSADWPLPAGGLADDSGLGLGDDDGSGSGSGGGDGGGGDDGGDDPPYCSQQILCYRGTCYEDPAENDSPQDGQCPGVMYRIDYTINNTQSYFEILEGPISQPQLVFVGTNSFTGPCRGENYQYQVSHANGIYRLNLLGSTQRDGNSAPSCLPPSFRPTAFSITRLDGEPDDCGNPPPSLGPPCDANPEEWKSICSSNPPIRYTTDTNSDRTLVIVSDAFGELTRLDFKAGQYQIHVGCKEEGCPEADCSAKRFYYRDLPEPPNCPFLGGQCDSLYLVDGVGSYFNSFQGQRQTAQFTSRVLRGPINNARIVEDASADVIRWFIDGIDPNTGAVITHQFFAVTGGIFGDVSAGEFDSITIDRQDGGADDCGNLPECDPPPAGSWTAGVLSFAPPIQVSATTNGDGSVTLAVYDAASSAADPLATYTLPDETYETATRCEDEGPPPQ